MVVEHMPVADLITAAGPIMEVTRVRLLWRLAIGLTTFAALATMQAAPITCGDRDIGGFGTVSESGSTAITSCAETDRSYYQAPIDTLNDWLHQAPARKTETQSCCQTAQTVTHASTKID